MVSTARKNIFDLISQRYDLAKEVLKIDVLFSEAEIEVYGRYTYTIEDFVDEYALHNWKHCGSYLGCAEISDDLSLCDFIYNCRIRAEIELESLLLYTEYVLNMIKLCNSYQQNFDLVFDKNFTILVRNINILLDHLNYKEVYIEKEEKVILVEKDSSAIMVAEIVEEDVAFKVLEYNHHLLKGNLSRKREILKTMADEIEAFRKQLDSSLSSDFGFLVNSVHIRHNNLEGDSRKQFVADMDEEQLEFWYDEAYRLMIYCILQNEQKERSKRIKELKKI